MWAAHLIGYKPFCKMFCQLDCASIVAHRRRRAAIGDVEVSSADAAIAQCYPALKKLTSAWDDVQFVQQLIRWARARDGADSSKGTSEKTYAVGCGSAAVALYPAVLLRPLGASAVALSVFLILFFGEEQDQQFRF